ncbi:hypothetical protein DFH08DRAFT_1085065 [Mycena albidolilacea]|uniref:Uncharacterized protein n=1 Tax=Mycena albidolilacea TaxID=1033008 RepID=A0AAD6ZJN5_9AGAR|nr:hypothetical protein DFH08DRAFT_1085065 [Mycena albidolilacea]
MDEANTDRKRLLRPIQSTDWDRVRVYAYRITELYCVTCEELSPIFQALDRCVPGDLLSDLHGLTWWCEDEDFQYIRLFLRAGLTGLSLSNPPESGPHLSLLSTLAVQCPGLRHVLISGYNWKSAADSQSQFHAISVFIRGLQYIESIHTDSLDQDALDHLDRLPTLCKLSLRSILPTYASSQNTDTPLFAALRKLDIWHVDVGCMTHFLSLCGPLQLISLDLPLHNSLSTASEMHNLLGVISSKVSLSSLTTVAVGSQGRWDDFLEVEIPTDHVMYNQSLRMLLPFSNLTTVSIASLGGFNFDNATISAMTRAWPHIESLRLAHLRTLKITLDFAAVPAPYDSESPVRFHDS